MDYYPLGLWDDRLAAAIQLLQQAYPGKQFAKPDQNTLQFLHAGSSASLSPKAPRNPAPRNRAFGRLGLPEKLARYNIFRLYVIEFRDPLFSQFSGLLCPLVAREVAEYNVERDLVRPCIFGV